MSASSNQPKFSFTYAQSLLFDNPQMADVVFIFKKGTLKERRIFFSKQVLVDVADYFQTRELRLDNMIIYTP
jgi:hypothetical protein